MSTDFQTFFDIYVRPSAGERVSRESYEFRYAAATLMIACSKADMDEDPQETAVITGILRETFDLSPATLETLLKMADMAVEQDYLADITDLVNESYSDRDKRYLLQNLWRVAYADSRIDAKETAFIERIAGLVGMSEQEVSDAKEFAAATVLHESAD